MSLTFFIYFLMIRYYKGVKPPTKNTSKIIFMSAMPGDREINTMLENETSPPYSCLWGWPIIPQNALPVVIPKKSEVKNIFCRSNTNRFEKYQATHRLIKRRIRPSHTNAPILASRFLVWKSFIILSAALRARVGSSSCFFPGIPNMMRKVQPLSNMYNLFIVPEISNINSWCFQF